MTAHILPGQTVKHAEFMLSARHLHHMSHSSFSHLLRAYNRKGTGALEKEHMSFTAGTIPTANKINHITGGKREAYESTTWDATMSKELFACILFTGISMSGSHIKGKTSSIITGVTDHKMLHAISN